MNIIFLLPPSEGKNIGEKFEKEDLSFSFEKPYTIAINATQKDLKCSGNRFIEGIELNTHIETSPCILAIERYSGVMYHATNYAGMSESGKKYFQDNFLILSGMYGLLRPTDMIGNYKLPIETKGLYAFWGEKITDTLNELGVEIIIDFLPNSYKKLIQWEKLTANILRIDFFHEKNGQRKKMSHGVKKIKGEYIKNICENGNIEIPDFGDQKDFTLEIDVYEK